MSKMIDKQKLMDWIEMQQLGEIQELELDRAGAYGTMYEEIESGRFDVKEDTTFYCHACDKNLNKCTCEEDATNDQS